MSGRVGRCRRRKARLWSEGWVKWLGGLGRMHRVDESPGTVAEAFFVFTRILMFGRTHWPAPSQTAGFWSDSEIEGEAEGEAGVVGFSAAVGGVVVVVAEVEFEAGAAGDFGDFEGEGGVGGDLVALVVFDGNGVDGVLGEGGAVVDDVLGAEADEGVEIGGLLTVEESFVDDGGAAAEIEVEFFAFEKVIAGTEGRGGTEGDILDGVVEFMVFSEAVPALGLVELGEGAAVDDIEVGVVGGLIAVGDAVIEAEFEGDFVGFLVVVEVGLHGDVGRIGVAGGGEDAEGELVFPVRADGEEPGFEIEIDGFRGGDGGACGRGGGGDRENRGGRRGGFGFVPAGGLGEGGNVGGVGFALGIDDGDLVIGAEGFDLVALDVEEAGEVGLEIDGVRGDANDGAGEGVAGFEGDSIREGGGGEGGEEDGCEERGSVLHGGCLRAKKRWGMEDLRATARGGCLFRVCEMLLLVGGCFANWGVKKGAWRGFAAFMCEWGVYRGGGSRRAWGLVLLRVSIEAG